MLQRLEELMEDKSKGDRVVPVESVEMYEIIAKMGPDALHKKEVMVSTKYKPVRVDEFAEAFARRAIYSIGDLYSGYDHFQLPVESQDITTMRTRIRLVRMCTLPQGAKNSVAHMMNAMNKVLRDCIPGDNDVVPR